MSRLSPYFIFSLLFSLATLLPLSAFAMPSTCTVGANIYYISQAGSDSNTQAQARSQATAWKHAPYMHSFTGSYNHTSGDCFIFRGGDTWSASDYLTVSNGGSSSAPDYYGVDQTWYTGSAWARPLINLSGTNPRVDPYGNSDLILLNASWVTFDNWEIINGGCTANPQVNQTYFNLNGHDGITVTNGYYHSFVTSAGGCGSGKVTSGTASGNNFAVWIYMSVASTGGHGSFDHNIVDGSDGSGAKGYWTVVYDPSPSDPVSYNVVHDICSGFGGSFTLAHDNLIYNFGASVGPASNDCTQTGSESIHEHAIRSNNDADVYNNAIHDTAAEVIMVNPNAMASHPVSHVYNNVLWHNGGYSGVPVTAIQTGDNAPNSSGSIEIYNNTIDCDSDGGWGSCLHFQSNINSVSIQNQHHIMVAGAPLAGIALNNPPFNSAGSGTASTLTYGASNNLYQTQAQATAAGYTNSQTYVFSPTASNSPTVGIGTNSTTLCNSDMPYLCNDTSYGAAQNGGTLTTPAMAQVGRPPSSGWNVGAYQFGTAAPLPPTGLMAVVQ